MPTLKCAIGPRSSRTERGRSGRLATLGQAEGRFGVIIAEIAPPHSSIELRLPTPEDRIILTGSVEWNIQGAAEAPGRRDVASTMQVIADLRGTDEQEAERFFREVQSYFSEPVPEGTIVRVLRKRPGSDLTTEQMAAIIAREQSERAAGSTGPSTASRGDRVAGSGDSVQPLTSPIRRQDSNKHAEGMDKCKHGVLLGRPCHICKRSHDT